MTDLSHCCAIEPCLLGSDTDIMLSECIICGKNVHHMCLSEKYREITASDQWCSDQCHQVSTSSTQQLVLTTQQVEIGDDAKQKN